MKLSAALLFASASLTSAFAPTYLGRSDSSLRIAVGDQIPSATLFKGFPDPEKIDIAEYTKGKKMIIIGLPGAFTPT